MLVYEKGLAVFELIRRHGALASGQSGRLDAYDEPVAFLNDPISRIKF